ncbi:MAG TPA: multiheme c-type cytochrome [Nannocystaceae bacterium]|nr:multiheme c-type cytochrome [Nannocystaceae bacterium]
MSTRRKLAIAIATVVVLQLGLAFAVYRDLAPPPLPPAEPITGVGGVSAELCRTCHAAIYDEWAKSGHARAFVDPLYQAELAHNDVTFPCERCHTPMHEQRATRALGLVMAWPTIVPIAIDNRDFDPALQREGVTCVACHLVEGELVGPFDDASTAPHPTRKADLRAVDLCARCHQLDFDVVGRKLDRPVLDTVAEWRAFTASGGQERCVDCHMPSAGERAGATRGPMRASVRHDLPGPFDAAFVAARVVATASTFAATDDRGARAVVELENRAGHRVPTAEPQRAIVIELAALDANDVALARTQARIERPIDVETLRPLGPDTTLAIRERREQVLELPGPLAPEAVTLLLTVDFVLWDPAAPVVEQLGAAQPRAHRLLEQRVELP